MRKISKTLESPTVQRFDEDIGKGEIKPPQQTNKHNKNQ